MANARARSLRVNMTDAEKHLWTVLRSRRLHDYKFRRQRPLGPYILDFACLEHRLAIEADGGQHADDPADARRTQWLLDPGWRVLRFWNHDILENAEGVTAAILQELTKPSPSHAIAWAPPSPAKAGEGL